jgi:hypothetical protein
MLRFLPNPLWATAQKDQKDRRLTRPAACPNQKGLLGANARVISGDSRARAWLTMRRAGWRALPRLPLAHTPLPVTARQTPPLGRCQSGRFQRHANDGPVAAAHWPAAECR